MAGTTDTQQIKTHCALCLARCGAVATVEDGRFVSLAPDPSHPTGRALCAKGRAAPELVYSPDRLLYPMKRTRPKGQPDAGWTRIGWDEALDLTAKAMKRAAELHGPEAVAFTMASGSTTALAESVPLIRRLMNAFGTPNVASNVELCGWGRGFATLYTYGIASVATGGGGAMPDIENAGCVILWGYNPSMTRLTHGTAVAEAVKRGARLVVVDPRRIGLASKADVWLRVRPGTDGALALGLANIMIERGWYDRQFIQDWSNAPMLVRTDEARLLTEKDLTGTGDEHNYCAWDARSDSVVVYDTAAGHYRQNDAEPVLEGEFTVNCADGPVTCRTVFAQFRTLCRQYSPDVVEEICWIERQELERAADIIWNARPTAYYAYSGHEQHTNTSQTARALSLLYALTGCFDRPGGNVLFPTVPGNAITGEDLPSAKTIAPALSMAERPLGPGRWKHITSRDLYRAILEDDPYPVRALVGFGANILVAHAAADRGREALSALDFFVHADMFMTPTSAYADVILPVASAFEREALKVGFEVSAEAQSLVQLRPPVAPPRGECRSDAAIVFGLAQKLALGDSFWDGDLDAAYRHQLAPSGLTLEALRDAPGGLRVPLEQRHEKYADVDDTGAPQGFATPSGKVEIWSETFRQYGYAPLPEFVEPEIGPTARPDLAETYPLVLTSAKSSLFCNSQHRGLPSLRRREQHPTIDIHPDCAAARGVEPGDWVEIVSPAGRARAVVRLNATLDPRTVVGQHGWWQSCGGLDAPWAVLRGLPDVPHRAAPRAYPNGVLAPSTGSD
jgi:anaerobic selenocysteine-containing dehydrogenase